MIKRNLSILGSLLLATISLAAVSCVAWEEFRVPVSDGVKVRLSIRMPRPVPVGTRAADADYAVGSLDLLVFHDDGGEFIYRYKVAADLVSQSGNSEALFEAMLYETDKRVKLLAIANCPAGKLNALGTAGLVTETEVRDVLTGSMTEADPELGDFVMTGDITLEGGISHSLGSLRIPVMRTVAKITIEKAQAVDNFEIRSISVYRSADLARYFPNVDAIVTEDNRVNIASVPETVDYSQIAPLTTNFADGLDGVFTTYLNENRANDIVGEETCIVVGGYFNGDPSRLTYYRMDFDTEGSAPIFNPMGQVLRNYWYRFTIESVAGYGWNTPDDAANHPATQLEATVLPWNGGTDSEYHFGDDRYVILSAGSLMLDIVEDHTDAIFITTSELPFTITSGRDPSAGPLYTADPGRTLRTDLMSFSLANTGGVPAGQQRWMLTATALTADAIGDDLYLEALDGLISIRIPVRRNGDFSVDRTSELESVPATGTLDRSRNYTRYVEYEINIPASQTWSARVTGYGWASGNDAGDHRGWLLNDADERVESLSGRPAYARLRVGFDKLYYPIVRESPRVTIEVSVDGHPGMRQTIVVGQDMLPSFTGPLKVIDMYSDGYGSVQTESYITRYSQYLKSARMYGPGGGVRTPGPVTVTSTGTGMAAIPASINPSFRYVHVGGNYTAGYTQQRHDVINSYWSEYGNDRIFVYAVEQRTNSVFDNATNNGDKRTTVLSTLGVDYLQPTGTGYVSKITTDVNHQRTAVFRYLTEDGPFGHVNDFADHGYQNDGTSSGVARASLPPTAVPIIFDSNGVTGGCVMMFIDPANGVVYWGDGQLFDVGSPAFRTADQMADGNRDGHSIFLANLLAYIVNCAQYGSSFADLFIADELGNYPLYEAAFP